MASWQAIDRAQRKLNAARGELRAAVINFGVPDDKVLELRAVFRHAEEEFRKVNRKKGLLGFFGL